MPYTMTKYTGTILAPMVTIEGSGPTVTLEMLGEPSGQRAGRDETMTVEYIARATHTGTGAPGLADTQRVILSMLGDTIASTTTDAMIPVSVDVRCIDAGAYRVTLTLRSPRSLGYQWTGSMRASTTTTTTFRDAYGSLILSTYGQETPRLHEVQRLRGQVEIVLRRVASAADAAALMGMVGTVNASVVDISEAFGPLTPAGTVQIPARFGLVTGVRADPLNTLSSALMVELCVTVAGVGESWLAPLGPWDAIVIWADANGVTPPDATPIGYQIQPATEWYAVPALYSEVSS